MKTCAVAAILALLVRLFFHFGLTFFGFLSRKNTRTPPCDSPIEGVLDILELEDDQRNELLGVTQAQMVDVAEFCNGYPSSEVEVVDVKTPKSTKNGKGNALTLMSRHVPPGQTLCFL